MQKQQWVEVANIQTNIGRGASGESVGQYQNLSQILDRQVEIENSGYQKVDIYIYREREREREREIDRERERKRQKERDKDND